MKLTEAEKGYLAGLFDGEGCVGYYCRSAKSWPSYHSASLHIAMTERQSIDWIMERVGYGHVSYVKKSDGRKSVYSWQLCNKLHIQEVLEAICPYLKVKANQVDTLLILWEAEKAFPARVVSEELIELRQQAADDIKLLKQAKWEGVETRRAGSF